MKQLNFDGIDWNEKREFIHINETIKMDFNELLKKSKPIFNNIYRSYKSLIPFDQMDDVWQECSIKCMEIFATPNHGITTENTDKVLSIFSRLKANYNYVVLGYISKNKKYRETKSLDEEISDEKNTYTLLDVMPNYDEYKLYEEVLTAEEITIVNKILEEIPEEILASKIENFDEKLDKIERKLAEYFGTEHNKARIKEYKYLCRPQVCDPKKERQRLTDKKNKKNRTIEHKKFMTWWKDQTETQRTMQAKKDKAIEYKKDWRDKVMNAQKNISLRG